MNYICRLFSNAVSCPSYRSILGRLMNNESEKDVEGRNRVLILSTIESLAGRTEKNHKNFCQNVRVTHEIRSVMD
jgi:hypothetical protein